MTLTGYSQKKILNNGDTLICLSIDQVHFLQKKYYEVKKWKYLDSICENQSDTLTKQKDFFKKTVSNDSIVISNLNEIILVREYEINKLNEEIKYQKKLYRRQKFKKIVVGAAGILGTGTFFYLWLTGR